MKSTKNAGSISAPKNMVNGKGKSNSSSKPAATKVPEETKEAQGLRELFEDSLKDIYWAEKALVKAIPKMIRKASSDELITALEEHLAVTEEQAKRLEQAFSLLNKAPRAKKCEAMEGLIKEAESIMEETEEGVVRDAGIIAAGQKVEHYEIATYGTLYAFANILKEDRVAALLEKSLNEEKEADMKLTEIAETSINVEAAMA